MNADLYKIVSVKLMNKQPEDCCGLCFKTLSEDAVSKHEEVVLRCSDKEMSESVLNLLRYVLGDQVSATMELFESICDTCLRLTISSYKFIKNCKYRSEQFMNTVEALNNCFRNVSNDFTNIETLFVNINTTDGIIEQFYDTKRLCTPQETALPRFRFIARGQINSKPNKKPDDNPRVRDFSTIFIKTTELMADPTSKTDFKCKICTKSYPSSGCLRQHFFSKHFKKEFQCTECSKCFGTLGLLQSHIKVSHFTVQCPDCGKMLKNRTSTIKRHQMAHMHGVKMCYRCGRSYKKTNDFKKHMAQESCGVPSRVKGSYYCDHCGYHCNFKHQLISHIKYEHTGAPAFVCKWCGKRCYNQSALNMHILKHTKEKNFICVKCGGKFVSKQSLINHTRLHTGERPYKCEYCDQSFVSASRRKDHFERNHTVSTYDCEFCDARYTVKRSYQKHRRKHLTQKAYQKNINIKSEASQSDEEIVVFTEDIGATAHTTFVHEPYVTEVVVGNSDNNENN